MDRTILLSARGRRTGYIVITEIVHLKNITTLSDVRMFIWRSFTIFIVIGLKLKRNNRNERRKSMGVFVTEGSLLLFDYGVFIRIYNNIPLAVRTGRNTPRKTVTFYWDFSSIAVSTMRSSRRTSSSWDRWTRLSRHGRLFPEYHLYTAWTDDSPNDVFSLAGVILCTMQRVLIC